MPFPLLGALGGLAFKGIKAGVGALRKKPNLAGDIAGVLGPAAAGHKADVTQQNQQRLAQDQLRQSQHAAMLRAIMDRAELGAKRAQFGIDAPTQRARQAMMGDILANVQDVRATHPRAHVVNFEGGLRPSLLGPAARGAGAALASLGASQLGKDTFDVPDLPQAPELSKMSGGGALGGILGGASLGTGILGALFGNTPSVAQQEANRPLSQPQNAGFNEDEMMRLLRNHPFG